MLREPRRGATVKIAPAAIGAKGIDTDAKLTPEILCALKCEIPGLEFVVRYLSLGDPAAGDLDAGELAAILDAGLGVMLVQHVRYAGWQPTAARGAFDGAHAAAHAKALAVPAGMTLYNDLEGMSGTSHDAIAYASEWCRAVRSAGYDVGAYVGAGLAGLTSAEIFGMMPYRHYWSAASFVPEQSGRGWEMYQLNPQVTRGGIVVDLDVAQQDRRGNVPLMLVS